MSEDKAIVVLERDDLRCEIVQTYLHIVDHKRTAARFDLRPVLDGRRLEIGDWTQVSSAWEAPFLGVEGGIQISRQEGWLRYSVRIPTENLAHLTFFPGSDLYMAEWRTFHVADGDRTWDVDQDASDEVTSSAEVPPPPDYRGLAEPGDHLSGWIAPTPARVVAFHLTHNWLTLSVPGPLPIAAATFAVNQRRFSLTFDTVRLSCQEARIPEVYFAFGAAAAEDCLDQHAAINRSLGYYRARADSPAWWSGPYWGVLDEMMGLHDPLHIDVPPPDQNPATPEKILEWVRRVESITGVKEFLVVFDQCYFARYGEYVPIERLGGQPGFRKLIDDLRREGKRVGLYFHTYNLDAEIPEIQAHPEWTASDVDSRGHPGAPPTRPGMKLANADWTHPEARAYMLDRVRYLLSDEPDCLNADWLCVHNNRTPSPRRYTFHDPDWGIGDLMTFKVWQEVYAQAKHVKPSCMVRFLTIEAYLQPFVDRVYINEDWSTGCENWYKMARVVTRLYRDTLMDVTPWFLGMTKAKEFYMVMPAFGIPGTLALGFFIHPRGYLYPTRPRDHRRWACSWQVYVNAPMTVDQERRLLFDGQNVLAYRKYTAGPLAGFYAARSLSRQSYVTYGQLEARVGATESRMVNVPLPPGADVLQVEAIRHDGSRSAHPHEQTQGEEGRCVRMHVTDSGDEVMYYRIGYDLPS